MSTFTILLPIFALILAGYACRRRSLLGPTAASELNRFVVWLALPAQRPRGHSCISRPSASGLLVPSGVETFLRLLGSAASLCALVSLGLFLAEKGAADSSEKDASSAGVPIALTLTKLVAQPALTWWLAVGVLSLPRASAQMAVLLAALPTGTGPYMLAEFYGREAHVTSRTILYSTVASLATLSAVMAWLRMGE